MIGMVGLIAIVTVAGSMDKGTISDKLDELKDLRAEGKVTAREYASYRQSLLDSYFGNAREEKTTRMNVNNGDESIVFEDNFDTLNFSKWKHEITMSGGGNWEFEYYSNNRSNSFVDKDGILHLKLTLTNDTVGDDMLITGGDIDLWGGSPADACTSNAFYGCERTSNGANILNPIQSARIRTAETFSFTYGRVEVNASLPKGDWIWPAIWLLPKDQAYGIWPASGEIDIIESRGNAPGYPEGGVDSVGSTLHWGPFYGQDMYELTHGDFTLKDGTDFSEGFHVFGLEWTENYMITYVDTTDNVMLNVTFDDDGLWKRGGWSDDLNNPWKMGKKNAPFDQEFYLILNVAVGGTNPYFPDGEGGKCWVSTSPTAAKDFWDCRSQWLPTWTSPEMRVDFVRVYQ